MNEAVIQHFKRNYNLLIGENTAEHIKCTLGSAAPFNDKTSISVRGRDIVAGIPKTVEITSMEVQEALAESVNAIVEATKLCLENTPPELSADILDRGIALSGGGALLRGLDERLRRETSLPVIVAEDPLTCVVRGTGRVLEAIQRYQKVLTKVKRY
jgi:rod shape-determining protein MreB